MDRKRKGIQLLRDRNNKIYTELKDIIKEHALPYLPAKSLCRYKLVWKAWKLQISKAFFAHTQSNNFRDISGFFCQSVSNPPSFLSLDPPMHMVFLTLLWVFCLIQPCASSRLRAMFAQFCGGIQASLCFSMCWFGSWLQVWYLFVENRILESLGWNIPWGWEALSKVWCSCQWYIGS